VGSGDAYVNYLPDQGAEGPPDAGTLDDGLRPPRYLADSTKPVAGGLQLYGQSRNNGPLVDNLN
jgi:hypothetical protein